MIKTIVFRREYESGHSFFTKLHVRPAKTDQTVHPRNLISLNWAYMQYCRKCWASRSLISLSWAHMQYCRKCCALRSLISLSWTHMQYCRKCCSSRSLISLSWAHMQYYRKCCASHSLISLRRTLPGSKGTKASSDRENTRDDLSLARRTCNLVGNAVPRFICHIFWSVCLLVTEYSTTEFLRVQEWSPRNLFIPQSHF